ncbi:MAG: isoamylase early set domain-containing protein [Gemmatimonadaceae bacterium]
MMQDDADETIARIAAALRPLPDVDPSQKARVLVAVAAERQRARRKGAGTARTARWLGAVGALAAALVATVWVRGTRVGPAKARELATAAPRVAAPASPSTAETNTASVETRLVTRAADGVALQPVQLVLRAPDAHRVSVVGDFNGWDASKSTMTRDRESGLWSQTLALRPGRHVYAFVVDDSIWIRDPRTPAANDPDFGRPGSVMLVGRP